MRVAVFGLGVQGKKRKAVAGSLCVATVDPHNSDADYQSLNDLHDDAYDAALICVPDSEKEKLLHQLVRKGKHVLVEKPLNLTTLSDYGQLEALAAANNCFIYSAYNHRFEPHLATVADLLASGELGAVYRCNLFYGNGTAALVRESTWRDSGSGVIGDLGSHILDLIDFWFSRDFGDINLVGASRYENQAPDHAVLAGLNYAPQVLCEVSMVSWKNSFEANIICEAGSIHVRSLCKWSESELIVRRRVKPSGAPTEKRQVMPQGDPTWKLEFDHFVSACRSGLRVSLHKDLRIAGALTRLAEQAQRGSM